MLWVVLVLGGIAVWRFVWGYPAHPHGSLTRADAAFVAGASDAMFPPGGEIPESGVEAGVPEYLDTYLVAVPPRQRLLMHALFFLMEHATVFFPAPRPRGWRRFSALSAEQQRAVLEGWRTSSLPPRRLVFLALRSLLTMGYFASPSVMRQLDLHPAAIETPVVEADLLYPPVGRLRSEVRYGPGDLTKERPGPLGPDAPVHPDYAGGAR
jgi:hypothetical protein